MKPLNTELAPRDVKLIAQGLVRTIARHRIWGAGDVSTDPFFLERRRFIAAAESAAEKIRRSAGYAVLSESEVRAIIGAFLALGLRAAHDSPARRHVRKYLMPGLFALMKDGEPKFLRR